MKISFILSSLRLSGGVRVIIQYANRLKRRGHQLFIVVPNGTIDQKIYQEIDPDIGIITSKRKLSPNPSFLQLIQISLEMAIAVPKSDVIIATHTPTTIVTLIAGKFLRRGKVIWFFQDYAEMFDGRPIENWFLRHALNWHAYALTVSEACIQELHSFSSGRVVNVGEGIDTTKYYPRSKTEQQGFVDPDHTTIFFLGDTRPRKGMADFLTAMEIITRDEPKLVMWIASKENVDFQFSVPYKLFIRPSDDELALLYSSCDLFISAAWYEGFGLPPLEAMACGAAVVTTDSRGIHEFAVDGENCLVVPPKNPAALAEAARKLLHDDALLKKFRENGPDTAARFDWNIATDRFEAALTTDEAGE